MKKIIKKIFNIAIIILIVVLYLSFNIKQNIKLINAEEIIEEPIKKYSDIEKTIVVSSGKPDSESLVLVFLAEGYTADEQDDFLLRVEQNATDIILREPFVYFKDYITIYAIHTISNESGVSGEEGYSFACRNSDGTPKTDKCTPTYDTYDCIHKKDSFFKSGRVYSDNTVIYSMPYNSRKLAYEISKELIPEVDSINVLGNSTYSGGTAIHDSKNMLGVALTGTKNNPRVNTVCHEFGHAFGSLTEEYMNGRYNEFSPNATRNGDPDTVKWYNWIGINGIGMYSYPTSTKYDDYEENPWYRPYNYCTMNHSGSKYCQVCQEAIIKKIEKNLGKSVYTLDNIFTTTDLPNNEIRIDSINYYLTSNLIIPSTINGRTVTEINESAFLDHYEYLTIEIPNTVKKIGANAFKGCKFLKEIDIPTSVEVIDKTTFEGCSNLENIDILYENATNHFGMNLEFTNCNAIVNKKILKPTNLTNENYIISWDNNPFVEEYELKLYVENTLVDTITNIKNNYYDYSNHKYVNEINNYILVAKTNNFVNSDDALSKPRYLVKFDVGEYGTPIEDRFMFEGTLITDIPELKEIGYYIIAWNTYLEYSITWKFDQNVVTSDMTLKANWRKCSHNKKSETPCDDICHICGETIEPPHRYTWYYNETEHWQQCWKCKIEKPGSRGSHYLDFRDETDCTCPDYCVCNFELTIVPDNHDYKYEIIDEFQHRVFCVRDNCKYDKIKKHIFNQEVIDEKYLVHNQDCEHPLTYYKSCICGEVGTQTFTVGNSLGHKYNYNDVTYKDEKVHAVKCINEGCNHILEVQHLYNQEIIDDKYFAFEADCVNAKKYYKSCICGYFEEETFFVGNPLGHKFNVYITIDYKAHYYICELCNAIDAKTYEKHAYEHGCDSTCSICEYTRKVEHVFDQGESSETQRWLVCSKCGKELEGSRKSIFEEDKTLVTPSNDCTSASIIKTLMLINLLMICMYILKRKK